MDRFTEVLYEGNCHCKAVRFSTKLPSPLSQLSVVSCNCMYTHNAPTLQALYSSALRISYIMQLTEQNPILGSYCHISGSLLTFVDNIEIHQGRNSLKV